MLDIKVYVLHFRPELHTPDHGQASRDLKGVKYLGSFGWYHLARLAPRST